LGLWLRRYLGRRGWFLGCWSLLLLLALLRRRLFSLRLGLGRCLRLGSGLFGLRLFLLLLFGSGLAFLALGGGLFRLRLRLGLGLRCYLLLRCRLFGRRFLALLAAWLGRGLFGLRCRLFGLWRRLFGLRLRFWLGLRLRGRLGLCLGGRGLLTAALARSTRFRRFAFLAVGLDADERQRCTCFSQRSVRQRHGAQRRGCHEQADCRACENPWLAFHRWKSPRNELWSRPGPNRWNRLWFRLPRSRIASGRLPDSNMAISWFR
jgi:hypothetical protein